MLYVIPKGAHYARGLNFRPHFGRSMSFLATLTPSCVHPARNSDDFDISKVAGFSGILTWRNSIRLGWRISRKPDDLGPLEVWAYFHVRGKHHEVYLANVMPGHPVRCNLYDEGKAYRVEIVTCGRLRAARIEKPWTFPAGFRMFPYFGGNNTAPQDIRIVVE